MRRSVMPKPFPILILVVACALGACGPLNRTPPGNYSPSYASYAPKGPSGMRCDDSTGARTPECMLRIGGAAY